jgi:hypothetical protein
VALGASEAARWQAYQTRARMGAQLWFRVFVWMVLGWIALTVYVVWHETGVYFPQIQHAYFWRWMLCGILLRTPLIHTLVLRCSLPANGVWYQLGPLADWMNGPQMYYRPFTDWFWHYAFRTALVPLAVGAALLVWRARRLVDVEHILGLRLLPPTHHNRQLNGGWLTQALRGRQGKLFCLGFLKRHEQLRSGLTPPIHRRALEIRPRQLWPCPPGWRRVHPEQSAANSLHREHQ